ncbi:MAG: class 1 fructose-bisphosphatase [Chloroflexi bacterium]|nr:class 1 fructose-bisphosphatase [Chloroflexota bacterium]
MTLILPSKSGRVITIERHILETQKYFPQATGVLTNLLYDIALAGKMIASQMSLAGLAQVLGKTGDVNVQGEQVMKLDRLADDIIYHMTATTGRVAVLASEEHEEIIPVPEQTTPGKYILMFDPLDGSSNIDYDAGVGTIFAIYNRVSKEGPGTVDDCLQTGRNLVAAGYIVYGVSTMFVYTTGHGVHGFTLDPSIGEFLLTHENIRIPPEPVYYSTNTGNQEKWSKGVREFTKALHGGNGKAKPLSMRYVGALVVDFHRTLLAGGIFYYPGDKGKPQGKLRLTYEAIPLAYIAEQAGGYASDGCQAILDIRPQQLHQRTPLFVGSSSLVRAAEAYISKYDNAEDCPPPVG